MATLHIPLTRGFVALIDSRDFKRVSKHKWSAMPVEHLCYARTVIKGKTVLMHFLILPDRPGFCRDHINRNGLDNRRSNLRYATQSQNLFNRAAQSRTGFKGVVAHPCGKYMARITASGQKHYLGLFASPEVAARAYDAKAKELHGEFAYLNFPQEAA